MESSWEGISGVTAPRASAAVQGEGTEAWCSRDGGGSGGGVTQACSLAILNVAI